MNAPQEPDVQTEPGYTFCKRCRGVLSGRCDCMMYQDGIDTSKCVAHRDGVHQGGGCKCGESVRDLRWSGAPQIFECFGPVPGARRRRHPGVIVVDKPAPKVDHSELAGLRAVAKAIDDMRISFGLDFGEQIQVELGELHKFVCAQIEAMPPSEPMYRRRDVELALIAICDQAMTSRILAVLDKANRTGGA